KRDIPARFPAERTPTQLGDPWGETPAGSTWSNPPRRRFALRGGERISGRPNGDALGGLQKRNSPAGPEDRAGLFFIRVDRARRLELVRADDFAAVAGADRPPGRAVHGVFDEPDRAVRHRHVDAAGMVAARGRRAVVVLTRI